MENEKKQKKEFLVDGFLFQEEEAAEKAKKEIAGIRYIKSKTSVDEPQMILHMYNKMIEEKMFETQVGICYLKELQEYLEENPSVYNEAIKPIPIEKIHKQEFIPVKKQEDKVKKVSNEKGRGSILLNVVLILTVIAMFAITLTGNHPNILNYEEKLLDKYSEWEQELKEREKQVHEKEKELGLE